MVDVDSDNPNSETQRNQPKSEFSYLYKNAGRISKLSQQERREILLKEQKVKRHSFIDAFRDGGKLFFESESVEFSKNPDEVEEMDVVHNPVPKKPLPFRFMKSEWFKEIPDDMDDNWLFKLVPEGFRVLIVAKKHNTVLSNEKGRVLTMKTHLPGGGLDKSHGLTVLDGIYNRITKTIFILDCLHWNTMSLLDSETNFRFYWLKNKFDENYNLAETNKAHKLQLLDFFPAHRPIIQDKIFESLSINNTKILHEGITFYHKEIHYIFGETPLLGWLFTYMLPEKLSIDIPEENYGKMPKDYECLDKYLENLGERKAHKKKWNNRIEENREMEIS